MKIEFKISERVKFGDRIGDVIDISTNDRAINYHIKFNDGKSELVAVAHKLEKAPPQILVEK